MIERSTDTRQTLLYNELKVPEEKALFLGAYNYWEDADKLSFDDKLHRIRELTIRNERVKKHTLHFSVNFHLEDSLTDKKMKRIAHRFMRKIGFSDQPWLLYRHIDAGHPHMHIVTTSIRLDGSRINNDHLTHHRLIEICCGIEKKHQLVPALSVKSTRSLSQHPSKMHTDRGLPRLEYGKIPTKTGSTTG